MVSKHHGGGGIHELGAAGAAHWTASGAAPPANSVRPSEQPLYTAGAVAPAARRGACDGVVSVRPLSAWAGCPRLLADDRVGSLDRLRPYRAADDTGGQAPAGESGLGRLRRRFLATSLESAS